MGNLSFKSASTSYLQYTNDFELVIRASKELEYILETEFGAPSGKQSGFGLHDKITHVQNSEGLSQETVRKMRYLVTVRNNLVHKHGFNQLPDRKGFATSFDSVEKELIEKIKAKKGEGNGGTCNIM